MKYKKGTFVIVPNLDELKGKPSEMQAIYLWICHHADKDGVCFPTKTTISKEAGCSHNTVDKYIKRLVEDGFLETKERYTKNGGNTSNEYQLLILGVGTTNNGSTPPTNNGSQTISNTNHIHITKYMQVGTCTLPLSRGSNPAQRVLSIYGTLFSNLYGFIDNTSYPKKVGIVSKLLKDYTELQLAYLLIVYFNWNGMSGNDKREREFLINSTHSIGLFASGINKYVAYTKNVLGFSKEFDDSDNLLEKVGEYIQNLTTN